MRWRELLLAILISSVVPAALFSAADKLLPKRNVLQAETTEVGETTPPETVVENGSDITIPVLYADGSISESSIETYLVGVLLGEMPMSFDVEALKAQAVVARTYTMRRCFASSKHTMGAICTDSTCCQAYNSPEMYVLQGGSSADINKAKEAVEATTGQTLLYGGTWIEATYFSCSGGRTEDALAVWGTDIPYLQAVDSPGEENAAHHTDTVSFTKADFAKRLGLNPSGSPQSWFGNVTYTEGGGIDTIDICSVKFKGTELRQKLGVRSTAISFVPLGDTILVTTKGYGHRVGMSQYGAEAMAVSGSTYDLILQHYYPETTLTAHNPD